MKAKLPFGKKGQVEDDELDENEDSDPSHQDDATDATDISDMADELADVDEDDEESAEENSSLVHKLKAKLKSLKPKNKKSSDDDEEEEDDDEAAKKKKKSKILQYVIGGGLVVFLASDYIFPPDEPTPDPASLLKKRPKPTKPVQPTEDTTNTEVPAETVTETPTETISETPSDTTITEPTLDEPTEVAPVEDTVVIDEPAVTEEPAIDETPVENIGDENTIVTEPVEPSFESGEVTTDSIDGGEGLAYPGQGEDNLTDQILQDLEKQANSTEAPVEKKEYTSPPDYEYRGRGLVYNCAGKHWACVDAPSYKSCEDNASSVKFLNKKTECYPFNVYETTKGCENMQNRMVSSSAKTNFCGE